VLLHAKTQRPDVTGAILADFKFPVFFQVDKIPTSIFVQPAWQWRRIGQTKRRGRQSLAADNQCCELRVGLSGGGVRYRTPEEVYFIQALPRLPATAL
jgi:hypothetical protein